MIYTLARSGNGTNLKMVAQWVSKKEDRDRKEHFGRKHSLTVLGAKLFAFSTTERRLQNSLKIPCLGENMEIL